MKGAVVFFSRGYNRHRATIVAKNSKISNFAMCNWYGNNYCMKSRSMLTGMRRGMTSRGAARNSWSTCTQGTLSHCTVLYCTVLYCTVLYCTVPARQRSRRRARGCGRRDGGGGDARTCTISRINQHKLGYYQE